MMKDPTRGIGTNDFSKMETSKLIDLLAQVELWIEELGNRSWEDGQGWDVEQIRNDREYIEEMFKPELEFEIKNRNAGGKS